MKLIKIIVMLVFVATTAFESRVINAAEVRSISREIPVNGATTPSWDVNVECAGVEDTRVIQRIGKAGKWCSIDLPDVCGRKKVKVAKKVCGTHFGKRIDELSKTDLVQGEFIEDQQSGEITQEMIDLENQRILLEEERIRLKIKEIELKKKAISKSI